jgi:hypothetical protein
MGPGKRLIVVHNEGMDRSPRKYLLIGHTRVNAKFESGVT